MEIKLMPNALDDLEFWKKSGNKAILKKISELVENICETPFQGIGKPEPLKYNLSGSWSRRITVEHRLVYEIINDVLEIQSLQGRY